MPKDKNPAETYAQEKAGQWLYDAAGYCPFKRHTLEAMLRRAHEDGAATIKRAKVLTPAQREVVVEILTEHLAALKASSHAKGTPSRESTQKVFLIERIVNKLAIKDAEQENSND